MIYFYSHELSKRSKKYIFPLLATTDMLEKTECGLSSYLKNIWTGMPLYRVKIQMLNEIRLFLAILPQIILAYLTKNKGIVMLQKNLWLLHS